jgi:hypothetical protein
MVEGARDRCVRVAQQGDVGGDKLSAAEGIKQVVVIVM